MRSWRGSTTDKEQTDWVTEAALSVFKDLSKVPEWILRLAQDEADYYDHQEERGDSMSDRPVNEIRPGDRVYLSDGAAKGSIVVVSRCEGYKLVATFGPSAIFQVDKPLRILQPGDVVPSGATYAWVGLDGKLAKSQVSSTTWTLQQVHVPPYVILSMPTSEPSREEQREKLVKAYNKAMLDVGNAHDSWLASDVGDRELVEAVRVFGEAIDTLEKFDAEDAS